MGHVKGMGKGQLKFFDEGRSWLRLTRRVLGVLGLFALWVGSGASLSGCRMNAEAEQCIQGQMRCTDRGRELCAGDFYTAWRVESCPSDTPFCIETEPHTVVMAECASEPHCSATRACAEQGLCADSDDGCVATAEGCANACPNGECVFDGLRCPLTDVGCAASPDCKMRGYCTAGASGCIGTATSCAESDWCRADGFCGLVDSQCAITAEGCASSETCLRAGLCGLSSDGGSCEPTAEGCATSKDCREFGFCGFADGYCHK